MGLDFYSCGARWSYSGFHRFRVRLAEEIGVDLNQMETFTQAVTSGKWATVVDPIVPLLHHSDCDGELIPKECLTIAPRLKELVSSWEDSYDKKHALLLVDGMLHCVEIGEPLQFQ